MKKAVMLILYVFFLASCGGTNTSIGTKTSNINGSWHAIKTSSTNAPGGNLPVDIFIVQNGTTLSADHLSVVPTCSNESKMSGSITGNQVNMVITGNSGDTFSVTGTISDSTFITGNYAAHTSGCIPDDSGTITATLIPSVQSPSWSGTITSTRYPPGSDTFTANLTEDGAGAVSGTLVFSGKYCSIALNSTVSVDGQQTGNALSISDLAADGITIRGTVDHSALSFNGLYGISLCNGDDGTVMMTRP